MRLEPEWLHSAPTQRLLALLAEHHIEVCFVGGAVRDALAGRVPFDIDMMTAAGVDYVRTVVERAGFFHELRGARQDVVVLYVEGARYDIGTLGDADRHENLLTRVKLYMERSYDFTLNALILTPQGELHDPFGGVEDLQAGRVVFVRPVQELFMENTYHILRYFRAVAVFGNGNADSEVLALCAQLREKMHHEIVGWRRYQEVLKIAMAPKGVRVLRLMAREWILPQALDFQVSDLQAFEHIGAIESLLKRPAEQETRMLLFAVLASIPTDEAMAKLAQAYDWNAEQLAYYQWMVRQLKARVMVQKEWEATMGTQGFQQMVLAQWALEDDIVEAAPYFGALL